MKSDSRSKRRSGCPLNAALEMVGDRWSLLIVRDLMLSGRRTYNAFLEGGEQIATNVLAERLRRLEQIGILERQADPQDRRRTLYKLTPKGIDLAPVLLEMVVWAAKHEKTGAPRALLQDMTRRRAAFLARIRKEWETQG